MPLDEQDTELIARLQAETSEQTRVLTRLCDDVGAMRQKLHDIDLAIAGQPTRGQDGFAQRIERVEAGVAKVLGDVTALQRAIATVAAFGTAIMGGLAFFRDDVVHWLKR